MGAPCPSHLERRRKCRWMESDDRIPALIASGIVRAQIEAPEFVRRNRHCEEYLAPTSEPLSLRTLNPISPSTLLPEIAAKFGNVELVARYAVEGFLQGAHRSRHKGFSIEFAEHRQYVPGDDLRYLDWQVYARTDNYYIIQYEAETYCRIYVMLDVSNSMSFGSGKLNKLQYASYCAGALAYLVIKQRDNFGLLTFDSSIRQHLEPRSTPMHLAEIFRILDQTKPSGATDFPGVFDRFTESVLRRSLILVFSDLFEDLETIRRALVSLRFHGHEVALFQILDHEELSFPYRGFCQFEGLENEQQLRADPESIRRDYLKELNGFTSEVRRLCSSHQIDYCLVDTSQPFDRVLSEYLERRTRYG